MLFHSVDLKKEKIYIIDPTLVELGRPFPLDLERFNEGWREMQNLAIVIYPDEANIRINKANGPMSQSLEDFIGEDDT